MKFCNQRIGKTRKPYLLKALVGVDVVEPGELVLVQQQSGRVQDQLGGRPEDGAGGCQGFRHFQ